MVTNKYLLVLSFLCTPYLKMLINIFFNNNIRHQYAIMMIITKETLKNVGWEGEYVGCIQYSATKIFIVSNLLTFVWTIQIILKCLYMYCGSNVFPALKTARFFLISFLRSYWLVVIDGLVNVYCYSGTA